MVKTKKFGGKVYRRRDYAYDSKRDAQTGAKSFRGMGQLVRVVKDMDKYGGSWYCYIHIPEHLRIKKVKSAQKRGKYTETAVDKQKKAADFRLLQVSPNVIRWKGGKTETVSARTLKKLQEAYTWATDF